MRHTEQIAKPACTSKAGLLATLGALFHGQGSGVPKTVRGIGAFKASRPLSIAALVLAAMALTAAPALARTVHAYTSSFGSEGSGNGQFKEPSGVAVNEVALGDVGDVYVVDKGNDRVERFAFNAATKAYEYASQFDGAPGHTLSSPEGIAIDNSGSALDPASGDVYVADVGHSVIDKFSAAGTYEGQLTGTCEKTGEVPPACVGSKFISFTPNSSYRGLRGVAVDPAGNVWVLEDDAAEEGIVDEFSDTDSFEKTFNTSHSDIPGLAVDSSDNVYLADEFREIVRKYEAATGTEVAQFSEHVTALAIDPESTNNNVFVDHGSSISEYGPGGAELLEPSFPAASLSGSAGVAVNGVGTVFASQSAADSVVVLDDDALAEVSTEVGVSNLATRSATLNGTVNPAGVEVTSCEFEYGTTTSYGHTVICETEHGEPVGKGTEPVSIHANLAGLSPSTIYHYRLVVSNADNLTEATPDQELRTKGAGITEEQATGIEATAATLQAKIDPNESKTTALFEYDTTPYAEGEAPHGTSVPAQTENGQEIGSGTSPVPVSVRLKGLQPGTTYYYRVVATDTIETFDGPGEALTTRALASPAPESCPNAQLRAEQPFGRTLPDCRAYEMVSPLEANGQDATDPFVGTRPRAAVSGEAVTYSSKGSFDGAAGDDLENQFLSHREPGGWSTQPVTPLQDPIKTEASGTYLATVFTPELTKGVTYTSASLTGEAPSFGLYVDDFVSGNYQYVGQGVLIPLGASTDLSHVIFGGSEWVNGKVVPVAVANNGKGMEASIGSQEFYEGSYENELWHAVSADGSRVYFTSPAYTYRDGFNPTPGQLYLRENAEQEQSKLGTKEECVEPTKACTVEVSASQRSLSNPAGVQTAHYRGASADGSKVFFTSTAELTEDAYTGPHGDAANLYEYDLQRPEGERLKDLTVDETDVDGAGVRGVVQISEEGSYVYFVAEGALTKEKNAQGAQAEMGQPNLYVSHEGGPPRFIATLAAGDSEDWDGPTAGGHRSIEEEDKRENESGPVVNNAVVAPDGMQLAFMSFRKLTSYNNQLAEGPYRETCERAAEKEQQEGQTPLRNCKDANEIYLYDAETGGLVCASCNSSGARPTGPSSLGRFHGFSIVQYRGRNLLEDGTLFFDSDDALVSHASDGRQNVYEYEDGHVYAISDVAGGYESFFMDASANGENVFFGTADQLLPQDRSNNVVVWDARVGGGFPVSPPLPSCDNGDSCKPPVSPQPAVFGAPSSATFSGRGDVASTITAVVRSKQKTAVQLRAEKLAKALKQCKRERKKAKRKRCGASARKRYGAANAKKAGDKRGAKS